MKLLWNFNFDFFKSLRFRLTAWNTFVVLIIVIFALLAVREGLRYYMLVEIDAVLDAETKEIVLTFERLQYSTSEFIAFLEGKDAGYVYHHWHIQWLDETGETRWKSEFAPEKTLSIPGGGNELYKVWTSPIHRSVEREIEVLGGSKYRFRVGTEIGFIQEDVHRLTMVLAPVSLVILLLSPIGGYVLATRAVEPLQRLIQATERLRASHLDERLELRGVGDELDQLAGKINTFLDQIADHLKKNRDFVANAAHDLRSPLAAIQSSVEVALENPRSFEEYEEILFQINDEVHHLGQLVNQLLQLAESESAAGDVASGPVGLAEIVTKTIEMFEPVAEERGIRLVFSPSQDIVVKGVPHQLKQVITNLVDNAIKFTEPGGLVTVSLLPGRNPQFGELVVSDTGVGIAPENIDRIFDRFYQVEESRNRFGEKRGNGLGLSICKAIIVANQGTIEVTSEYGKGTTFLISLPLAETT